MARVSTEIARPILALLERVLWACALAVGLVVGVQVRVSIDAENE